MTDLEISKQLALAIGWKDCNIDPDVITIRDAYAAEPEIHCWDKSTGHWRIFDYRDWNVIGPIAEKFDCFPYQNYEGFPYQSYEGRWVSCCWRNTEADTPQKAIALAVIEGSKK